jgi:hypothetical protein
MQMAALTTIVENYSAVQTITHSVCVTSRALANVTADCLLTVTGNVDYGLDDGIGGDGDETRQEARGAMPKSG